MAKAVYPEEHIGKALYELVNHEQLIEQAKIAEEILSNIPEVFVPRIQYKSNGYKNTCWYVAFKSHPDVWVANFTIIPSSLNIELRYPRFFDLTDKHKQQYRVGFQNNLPMFMFKNMGMSNTLKLLKEYLGAIRSAVSEGEHMTPSRSSAEYTICSDLRKIFPKYKIRHGERPIKHTSGSWLELDIQILELKLAIEVQGPTHFRETDIYGNYEEVRERDNFKKQWCADNGILLIHLNWDAYMRTLHRMVANQRREALKELVYDATASQQSCYDIAHEMLKKYA
ncbi:hypothetical protein NB488_10675 [Vibrio alginolyticus]|nr:hypothetical protein [Vibrio alginolyticus]